MKRPTIDEYYLEIAKSVALRSTCIRKHYGAVIVKMVKLLAQAIIIRLEASLIVLRAQNVNTVKMLQLT
jgi:hypothetical protein